MAFNLTQDIVEPTPASLDLTGPSSQGVPAHDPEIIKTRADKYSMAMGDSSPGPEKIKELLQSPGGEDTLRRQAADIEQQRRREGAAAAFKDNVADPSFDAQAVAKAGTRPVDPETALERQFAEKAMGTSLALTKNADEVSEGYTDGVSGVEQAFIERIAKLEAFNKLKEDAEARVKQLGWTSPSYWADWTKSSLVPGYGWYKQVTGSPAGQGSKFHGYDLQAEVEAIRAMPPEEAIRYAKERYEKLAADNLIEARTWVSALADGYGSQDAFETQLGDTFDVVTAAPVGLVAKAGKGAVVAGKTIKNEVRGVKDVAKAGSVPAFARDAEHLKVLQGLAAKREALNVNLAKLPEDSLKVDITKKVLDNVTRDHDALKAALAESKNSPAVSATIERIRRTTLVTSDNTLSLAEKLSGAGHVDEAAEMQATDFAKGIAPDATFEESVKDLVARTPSLSNPKEVLIGATEYSRVQAERMAQYLEEGNDLFRKAITRVLPVARIPAAVEGAALDVIKKDIEDKFKAVHHAILSSKVTPSVENRLTNTAYVTHTFGTPKGGLFRSREAALNKGRNQYGMEISEKDIFQDGDGYVIKLRTDLNETTDNIRDSLLTINNQSNTDRAVFGLIPKFLQTYKNTVSPFQAEQRAGLNHAQVALQNLVKEASDAISYLSKKEYKALDKIMKVNRDFETIPGKGDTRGMFYNNIGELESAYIQHVGRIPTDVEVNAYFSFVRASDLDYIFRSSAEFTHKARQGAQKVGFKYGENEVSFEGKAVEYLPFNSDAPASVFISEAPKTGKGKLYTLKTVPDREALQKAIREGKFVVTQTWDPLKVSESLGVSGPVNFIVTPNVRRGAISLSEQLPYRPGFHVQYKDNVFIKQPRVAYTSAKQKIYSGDTALFGMSTEAKGQKYAAALEEARQGYLAKDDARMLAASKNLPFDLKELKQAFKRGTYDKDTPFYVTRSGQSAIHPDVRGSTGKSFVQENSDFADFSNSPFNLSQQARVGFTGEKDAALWSIEEAGSEANPLIRLSDAKTIDPIAGQVASMRKLIQSRHFSDYKLSAAETFIQEFGVKRGLLHIKGKPLTQNELRRNPVWYLMNADVAGLDSAASSARLTQFATRNLMTHRSIVAEQLGAFQAKLLNSVYNKLGDKYVEPVDTFTSSVIQATAALPSKLRAVAFHTKLGFLNPVQVLLQSQTLANITAIAPKHGGSGALVSMSMRRLDLLPADEEVVAKMAKSAAKLTPGWTEDMYKESYNLLKETGFDLIGGDLSYRNDLADPQLIKSSVGKFLDFNATLFNGTERFVRLAAWNTAYAEYINKFPKLAGKLDANDAKTILSRAGDLSGNMTRDAHAFWQEGSASALTQFWGYSGRMMDLLLGKRLTAQEKARLVGTWGVLYGVPVAGGAALPVWNWQDEMKYRMVEHGIDPNSGIPGLITNGLISTIVEAFTGESYNVGGRYGPSGISLLWNLTQNKYDTTGLDYLGEALGGASGNIAYKIMKDTMPVFSDAVDVVSGEGNVNASLEHVRDLLGNISTFKQADNAYSMYQYGIRQDKNNRAISDSDQWWEGAFHLFTGLNKNSDEMQWILKRSMQEEDSRKSAIRTEIKKTWRLYLQAVRNGEDKSADDFKTKTRILLDASGFTPKERQDAISSVFKEDNNQADLTKQWLRRHPDSTIGIE